MENRTLRAAALIVFAMVCLAASGVIQLRLGNWIAALLMWAAAATISIATVVAARREMNRSRSKRDPDPPDVKDL